MGLTRFRDGPVYPKLKTPFLLWQRRATDYGQKHKASCVNSAAGGRRSKIWGVVKSRGPVALRPHFAVGLPLSLKSYAIVICIVPATGPWPGRPERHSAVDTLQVSVARHNKQSARGG